MKFQDYRYERPNYEEVKSQMGDWFTKMETADTAETQLEAIYAINKIRSSIESMSTIANIRHTIATTDKFYDEENNYWNKQRPLYQALDSEFYEKLVNSKFRAELEHTLGTVVFQKAENALKAFSPGIIEDLQEENKLASDYSKLQASAKIQFKGEELTLAGLGKYMVDKDRNIRKEASAKKFEWFAQHEAEIDSIYDQLVKIRHRIAQKLGFQNFIELGYIRMNRLDYNASMVQNFRDQVQAHIVPLASELYGKQQERLGLETLHYYDMGFQYEDGNATPKGDPNWILQNGQKMYSELSPETKEFFDMMVEKNLLDLVNKPGKRGGGYCTYIPDFESPFIFSNFNGTSHDIDVLTHEAGHAFQKYASRKLGETVPEYNWPTKESAEIFSMAMEFFTWDWMSLFFKEDTAKYKYSHLGGAIKMLPNIMVVDAFQHFVYENPEATPEQRKAAWRDLEKQFLPDKNYSECDFLERGGWWLQIPHIFGMPFYYIDYGLAQIVALQFWQRNQKDHETAWSDYLKLCRLGGSKTFTGLLNAANLTSPFEDGCVSAIVSDIADWLRSNSNVEGTVEIEVLSKEKALSGAKLKINPSN